MYLLGYFWKLSHWSVTCRKCKEENEVDRLYTLTVPARSEQLRHNEARSRPLFPDQGSWPVMDEVQLNMGVAHLMYLLLEP